MTVIHVWDEFKRSDHGRTLWVKLDDAEARINKLEAALAERDMMLKRLYLWDGIETAADGPLVKTATKVVIRRTRPPP